MAFVSGFIIPLVIFTLFKVSQSENRIVYTKYKINQNTTTVLSNQLSKVILHMRRLYLDQESLIHLSLPTENGNAKQLLDTVAYNVASNWIVTIQDSFNYSKSIRNDLIVEGKIITNYSPDMYIIPVMKIEETEYFETQMSALGADDFFNPRAIFILTILTDERHLPDYSNLTTWYFNYLWKCNIMSVIISVLSNCDSTSIFLTAQPFSEKNPCRKINEGGITHHYFEILNRDLKSSIFNYNHKDFNKCNFLVATTPSPPYVVGNQVEKENNTYFEYIGGIDIELMKMFSEHYNFTYTFDNHNGYDGGAWFKFFPNNTAGGIVVDVLYYKTDLAFGGLMPSQRNYYKYDYTSSYKYSSLSWFVKDAGLSPQWKIFVGTFSLGVWIFSTTIFLATGLLYALLDYINLESLTIKCSHDIRELQYLELFRVALSLPSALQPRTNYFRVLLLTLNMFSLHLTIAYSTILFLLLRNPPLEKEIATIDDLKDSGLKVGAVPVYFEIFKDVSLDRTTRQILDNKLECPELDYCIKQLVAYKNFSLLEKSDQLEHLIDLKKAKIHKISQNVVGSGVSIMASKGNPLSLGLDKVVIKTFELGLIYKWERDANRILRITNQSVLEELFVPLSYSTVKGCFFILISGYIISFALFLKEILCYSFNKNK